MTRLRALSTAAAVALVVPLLATAGFAQNPPPGGPQHPGRPAPQAARPPGGAPRPGPAFNPGRGPGPAAAYNPGRGPGPGYSAPGPRPGNGYRGNGFVPGVVAGAVIGGAIAAQGNGYDNGYYNGGYYQPGYAPGYAQTYSDDQYDDSGPVAAAPAPDGDDAVAYCMQTYRSYDPRSGTYVGYDGYRHPCP